MAEPHQNHHSGAACFRIVFQYAPSGVTKVYKEAPGIAEKVLKYKKLEEKV